MIINKVLKNIKINIFFKLVFLVSVLVIFSDTFLVKAEGGCKDPAVCTCTEVTTCTCPVNPPTNPDPDPDPDPDPPKPPRIPPCLKPPCIVPEGDEGDVGYDQSEPNFSFLALVKNSIPKISNNIGGSGNSNVLGQASCDSCDSVPCSTDTTTCKSSGRECIRTGDNSFSCWWWTCSGNCYGGGCGPDNPSPPVTPPPSSGNSPGGVHDDSYCDNDGKIVSSGWACDADDYETPLEVRTYTGGTLIASGTANIPAEGLLVIDVVGREIIDFT